MTNLQQEILKEFDEKFGSNRNFNNSIKQFLLSALQRQMEEVKKCVPKEAKEEIKNLEPVEAWFLNGWSKCRSQLLTNLEKI